MRKTLDERITSCKALLSRLNAQKSSQQRQQSAKKEKHYAAGFKALVKAMNSDSIFSVSSILNGLDEECKNDIWEYINSVKVSEQQS